jgi:hypothetical protein
LPSGRAARHIALRMLIKIPLSPFPSMTAPIYFGGSIPATPNTAAYTKPEMIPKVTIITLHMAKPKPGDEYSAVNGNKSIRAAVMRKPPIILTL